MIVDLLFWATCLMTIAGALGAAVVRNLVRAALLLGMCLCGLAGLYLFLDAAWLACVQVVVYMGGILVLILFATLFSSDVLGTVQRAPVWLKVTGGLATLGSGVVAARLAQVAMQSARELDHTLAAGTAIDAIDPVTANAHAGAGAIGDLLVGPWMVPFLAISVLLTVALVAAVATVRRFRRPPEVVDA